jgi:hypothetical protein
VIVQLGGGQLMLLSLSLNVEKTDQAFDLVFYGLQSRESVELFEARVDTFMGLLSYRTR